MQDGHDFGLGLALLIWGPVAGLMGLFLFLVWWY